MGTLAQGYGFGTASQAAQSSMQFGQAGTLMSAGGQLLQGIGQSQQFGFQAQIAANNAQIEKKNATAAVQAGLYEESAQKLKTGQQVGAEKAAQGASNVDVNIGSPAAVRASTQTLGAMDAAMIHYNAAKEAYGYKLGAMQAQEQESLYKRAATGAAVSGLFGATSTLLAGGGSLASKWAQYQLSGATA